VGVFRQLEDLRSASLMGSMRMRLPVAANRALATAGPTAAARLHRSRQVTLWHLPKPKFCSATARDTQPNPSLTAASET
jgi:hypothetical protein